MLMASGGPGQLQNFVGPSTMLHMGLLGHHAKLFGISSSTPLLSSWHLEMDILTEAEILQCP